MIIDQPFKPSATQRIALGIEYDGTDWQGWQIQPSGRTIQNQLEAALHAFIGTTIATTCAGRTDAGVHAIEQVAHFDTSIDRPQQSWVRGLNAFLPRSIAVRWATLFEPGTDQTFHARFSALARTYEYLIYNHPVRAPLWVGRAGWVFRQLDIELMQQGANHLIGTHDFSAFRSAECQAKSPVRSLHSIELQRRGDLIAVRLRANAFLHHMVRNIIGSLIAVGQAKQRPEWIAALLTQRDRCLAAPTFMPDGLYLMRIDYEPRWNLAQQKNLIL